MKSVKADLLLSTTGVYGDTTKTFITPMMNVKLIASTGKNALGPPLNVFLPVFDDFGLAAVSVHIGNNRIFVFSAPVAGLMRCMLYDFNPLTGQANSVGSCILTVINSPATTHTVRAVKVDDGASSAVVTGWQVFVTTTGSVTANGGTYMAGSAAIGLAKTDFSGVPTTIPTATIADAKQVYKLENSPFTLTAGVALALRQTEKLLYMLNGVSATYQAYKVDYSLPTGVPGANGIITTLNVFGGTGITGNLPALTGTLLLTNSGEAVVPTESYLPVALQNNPCFFFATTTQTYLGLLSELIAGGTTWPSLNPASNLMPFSPPFINPTYVSASWSQDVEREVINIGSSNFIARRHMSGEFDMIFGNSHDRFLEAAGHASFSEGHLFGGITMTQVAAGLGWAAGVMTTVSQRGIVLTPIKTAQVYGLEYFITKVMDTTDGDTLAFLSVISQLANRTVRGRFQYRISGFAPETVGWTDVLDSGDLSALAAGEQIQIRGFSRGMSEYNQIPNQIEEIHVGYQPMSEMSDYWSVIFTHSTENSPAKVTFIQKRLYPVAPGDLVARGYDLSNPANLLITKSLLLNAADFGYSVDDGVTFLPYVALGNVVGHMLQLTIGAPNPQKTQFSIRES